MRWSLTFPVLTYRDVEDNATEAAVTSKRPKLIPAATLRIVRQRGGAGENPTLTWETCTAEFNGLNHRHSTRVVM